MHVRKVAIAAVTAGAIGVGALALGVLNPLNLAGAQSEGTAPPATTAPEPAAPPAGGPPPGEHGPRGRGPADLGVAATAIGISEADLRTALESGQSLADVARAHGVDPQKVIDALVAAEQAHLAEAVAAGKLTQAKADEIASHIVERVTARVNNAHKGGPGRPGGPGRGGPGHGHGPMGPNLGVAATAIGISEADLRTALESGQSLADVARAHGVDPQKVIDALVADGQATLDEAKAGLPQRVTDMVNGKMPKPPAGGPRGPGQGHGKPPAGQGQGQDPAPAPAPAPPPTDPGVPGTPPTTN